MDITNEIVKQINELKGRKRYDARVVVEKKTFKPLGITTYYKAWQISMDDDNLYVLTVRDFFVWARAKGLIK